jgi:hypothetical protein
MHENADLTVGAASPSERLVSAPRAEARFGLVLYGGVSLAIYIYGVVYEFWRLLRASEGQEDTKVNAWAAVLEKLNLSATVDIVSGASAGGINGVLLAKVLARGGDLEKVRWIWTEAADLSGLLRGQGEESPKSLLSTERFESLLEAGLAALDPDEEEGRTPLVKVFDLFVPATRLRPWQRKFRTDLGDAIETSQYRKQFELKLRTPGYNPSAEELGYDRNDFAAENNDLLARVARSTSAFGAAFEPKRFDKSDDPEELLFSKGEPKTAVFSDGGILHNKPFTATLATIAARASDRPVRRWLVSVEPDPEGHTKMPEGTPEVDEVISKSLFGIPRYQSIAADLDRLESHRIRAGRQRALLDEIDRRLTAQLERDRAAGMQVLEQRDSSASDAHKTERAAQLAADLAAQIAALATLSQVQERAVDDALQGAFRMDQLTEEADFAFERRRVYFLLRRLSSRLDLYKQHADPLREPMQELWAQSDRISTALWEALSAGKIPGVMRTLKGLDGERLGSAVIDLAVALNGLLAQSLKPIRDRTLEICARIDGLEPAIAAEAEEEIERLPFALVWEHYGLWDMFVLPIDPELGGARDPILFARISPEDACFIDRPAEEKLAGDTLAHFSGFLKQEWRENDILWGRLDAAEMIVRMLAADAKLPKPELDGLIERVQAEIVRHELPRAPEDYRGFLEDEKQYNVGGERLIDLDMRKTTSLAVDSVGVMRNMVGELERARAEKKVLATTYKWFGKLIGWVLAAIRWPVRAIFGQEPLAIRGVSFTVLFAAAWSAVAGVLIALEVIDTNATLWSIIGLSGLAFVAWTLVMALAHGRRQSEQPDADPGGGV